MKYYFLGKVSMANRGCEALIRSNTKILRENNPAANILCPSENHTLDKAQWPDAEQSGVSFVPVPKFPISLKLYGKLYQNFSAARRLGMMPIRFDPTSERLVRQADAVLMTGGDIISLEYGLNSLYFWAGLVDAAHRLGKPTHLLAASVGPFTSDPLTEKHMRAHLMRYTSISVRETPSRDYLAKLGIDAKLVADPAFVMAPEPIPTDHFMPTGHEWLGFNVSPLVRKFRNDDASRHEFDEGIRSFLRRVVKETGLRVLLIPHVDPLSGRWDNSDRDYMTTLLSGIENDDGAIAITPELLNAAQLKYILGKCRYFIGARTHATIGAISQGVPTLSIAYSVKAVGINKDLFGTTDYVLPTPEVSEATLSDGLRRLQNDETAIRSQLEKVVPQWKQLARTSVADI